MDDEVTGPTGRWQDSLCEAKSPLVRDHLFVLQCERRNTQEARRMYGLRGDRLLRKLPPALHREFLYNGCVEMYSLTSPADQHLNG